MVSNMIFDFFFDVRFYESFLRDMHIATIDVYFKTFRSEANPIQKTLHVWYVRCTLSILTPQNIVILRTQTLRNAGSFTLPLEGPVILRVGKYSIHGACGFQFAIRNTFEIQQELEIIKKRLKNAKGSRKDGKSKSQDRGFNGVSCLFLVGEHLQCKIPHVVLR